ncbi:MAG: haloalkane dehalogenase [Nonlabens sp.]
MAEFTNIDGHNGYRTPASRFRDVDYPFIEHYAMIDGWRMHYVDENQESQNIVMLVHGEPTWGYLYRKMIPVFVDAGYRVIVPDLIGFGKSDKPLNKKIYTYSKVEEWFRLFVNDHLKLNNMNLVAHDWGGLIALRTVATNAELFSTVTAMNTAFPRYEGINPLFILWRSLAPLVLHISLRKLMPLGINGKVASKELNGYDAPFPSYKSKLAARIFPKLVPVFKKSEETIKNIKLWEKLKKFDKPFLTIFSENDPFTKDVEIDFIKEISGAKNSDHFKVNNSSHYIQEEHPEYVSRRIIRFIKNNLSER